MSASPKRPMFIVTDDGPRCAKELFGGSVPAWAKIITEIDDLQTIVAGDVAMGVFHAPRRQATYIDRAFCETRKRCAQGENGQSLGLDAARMAGFYQWRKSRDLAPHFAVFDVCDAAAVIAQQTRGNFIASSKKSTNEGAV